MLDRWGTMTFAQVLQPAIDVAEKGFPLPHGLARSMGRRKMKKYPSSKKVYLPDGKAPEPGAIFRNLDAARMLRKLVEAEKQAAARGGPARGLRAARDRFYKGDIAKTMGEFSEQNGGLFRYEDFAGYTAKVETPVSRELSRLRSLQEPVGQSGPAELFLLNILEGYDLKALGHNSAEYIHTSAEALKLAFADREKSGRHGLHHDPLRRAALQGLRGRASQADRSRPRLARDAARQSRSS